MRAPFNLDEVLAMAERIERNGAAFYRRAAAMASDPEVRAALEHLAEWEQGHEAIFGRLRRELSRDPAEWLDGAETGEEILRRAVAFERDAILFFIGLQENVPVDLGREALRELIAEEVRHVAYLGAELDRLRGGAEG